MAIVHGSPGQASVIIAVKGTAVACAGALFFVRHPIFVAYEDNVGPIYIGFGSGVSTTRGTYLRMLRPGDSWEPPASSAYTSIDLSTVYINNDASSGTVGDGVAVGKPSRD